METCPCCNEEREIDEESGVCEECFAALCDEDEDETDDFEGEDEE